MNCYRIKCFRDSVVKFLIKMKILQHPSWNHGECRLGRTHSSELSQLVFMLNAAHWFRIITDKCLVINERYTIERNADIRLTVV